MGIVSKFFGIFKRTESVENNELSSADRKNDAPLVVSGNEEAPVMVRADEFVDSPEKPEEYTVRDDDFDADQRLDNCGVKVDDGDDMSPIIMSDQEETVVIEEKTEQFISNSTCNDIEKDSNEVKEESVSENTDDVELSNIQEQDKSLDDEEEIEIL